MLFLLDTSQLMPHFQGQYNCSEELIGGEILMRAKGKEDIAVAIAQAEKTNLIDQIDFVGLEAAIAWSKENRLPCSFNISPISLNSTSIIDRINLYFDSEEAKRLITFELTENQNLTNLAKKNIKELSDLGYRFSLDDCCTEFNCLARVHQMPFSEIKIDQTIVRAISFGNRTKAIAIVKTIVYLGALLNLDIVAEGVETQEELNILIECGCQKFQGYLWGKPEILATSS